jgi:hypothetical protein
MSFFKDIAGGVEKAQSQFLGPTYNYASKIRSPQELGMSAAGNLDALGRDVAGIINYTEVLVTGKGKGSTTGKPLGNRFYLKTGGKCCPKPKYDKDGNQDGCKTSPVDRYVYVNNIPTGSIPFISDMTGQSFSMFRGLVPGTIENVGQLNPIGIFGGFMQGENPPCSKLKLKDSKGRSGFYVANADISDLDPCNFGGRNPISGKRRNGCAPNQGFRNMNEILSGKKPINNEVLKLKENPLANLYNLGFGAFVIYILFHLMKKN